MVESKQLNLSQFWISFCAPQRLQDKTPCDLARVGSRRREPSRLLYLPEVMPLGYSVSRTDERVIHFLDADYNSCFGFYDFCNDHVFVVA